MSLQCTLKKNVWKQGPKKWEAFGSFTAQEAVEYHLKVDCDYLNMYFC